MLPARRGEGLGRRLLDVGRAARRASCTPPGIPDAARGAARPGAGHRAVAGGAGARRRLRARPLLVRHEAGPVRPAAADPARCRPGCALVPWSARAGRGAPAGARRGVRRPLGLDCRRTSSAGRSGTPAPAAFQPELSRLVLDGDRIAAYLLSYFYAADAEATGVREALHRPGRHAAAVAAARARRRCCWPPGWPRLRDDGYAQAALTSTAATRPAPSACTSGPGSSSTTGP